MKLKLRPLPYDYSALAPHVSADTVKTHYAKHHRGYLDKMNDAIAGGPLEGKPLREVVRESDGTLYNNAAQVWNHDFYWRSMSPEGGGSPSSSLEQLLRRAFGDVVKFKKELADAAIDHFGSGYAWLVKDVDGKLRVEATHDAENFLKTDDTALLAMDVWEHAYYLDRRNERADYVEAFVEHLINWEFIEENLAVVER
jgi:superoxide dismutase, Fe-Mn family